MQIRVSVELTGTPEVVGLLLAQLSDVLTSTESGDGGADWWTPERSGELVRELTDQSLQALAIITELAPRASFVDVKERMARLGLQLAPGHLSSIGFAVRRLGYPAPPFVRDYYQRAYLMEEPVAQTLGEAIHKELPRRDSPRR
jgi:hypothetical protein